MLATITAALKAFAALCGFGEKALAESHDAKQRKAGADAVNAEGNAESARVNENVAKAAVGSSDRTIVDSLRRGEF